MPDIHDTARQKVKAIFSELAGDRASNLFAAVPPSTDTLASAFADLGEQRAKDIAFHLTDWSEDAAFLVAVHLFPERFTPAEVEAGIGLLIVHAPNHLAAAAKLAGHPIQDVFEVGPLMEEDS
jgi:hypothetical protein